MPFKYFQYNPFDWVDYVLPHKYSVILLSAQLLDVVSAVFQNIQKWKKPGFSALKYAFGLLVFNLPVAQIFSSYLYTIKSSAKIQFIGGLPRPQPMRTVVSK